VEWEVVDRIMLPFSAVFGAIVGSFLNAAIHRLPRNISMIKRTRSFCPKCDANIAWFDNIPIISYMLLLGRCRKCRKRISPRYLFVELLTAGTFAALYWYVRFLNGPVDPGGEARLHPSCLIVYMPLVAGLILAAFIDLQDYEESPAEKRETEKRRKKYKQQGKDIEKEEGPITYGIIPDQVTITGMLLALPLALLFPQTHWNATQLLEGLPSVARYLNPGMSLRLTACFDVAIGAAVGAGMTKGMGIFGKVVFRKEAMGFGDVKLMGMLGALLGWKAAVLIFFIAPVFGSIFGIITMLMTGEHYLRYGPFLALAAVIVIFYEPLATIYVEAALQPFDRPEIHHLVPFLDAPSFRSGFVR
jgi:leader peptidase (prepilin peptidase) / N-methyltransferase